MTYSVFFRGDIMRFPFKSRRSVTSSNAETFILPFGRNPACISLASMSREGRRKHMAVQRCTKAAVGPPCLHKLFTRPKKE